MATYGAVHMRLRKRRGPAKNHLCQCGQPARDWAYRNIRGHSENLDDYVPMCRRCHKAFDAETVFNLGEWATERRRLDPEDHAKLMAWSSRNGLDVGNRQRQCNDCTMIANPGGMGQHLKHKMHSGWVAI